MILFTDNNEGSVSIHALMILIILALLSSAVIFSVMTKLHSIALSKHDERDYTLIEKVNRIASLTIEDLTPEADSKFDVIFDEAEKAGVSIQDVSSKFNPNWMRKNLLIDTALALLLKENADLEALQQTRVDEGLSMNIEGRYSEFFNEEAFETRLSSWSYANINVTDEFALERLYFEMTGDKLAASIFHESIQSALIEKHLITASEIDEYLGIYKEQVRKFITVEPQFNINMMDIVDLESLLSYPAFNYKSPKAGADAIDDARLSGELTIERVANILGISLGHPLFAYIGDKTWFWKLKIDDGDAIYTAVFSRPIPLTDVMTQEYADNRIHLVSWSYK